MNGSTPNEGRVEVLINGHWGTVCNNSQEHIIAKAVCSQLGFSQTGNWVHNEEQIFVVTVIHVAET